MSIFADRLKTLLTVDNSCFAYTLKEWAYILHRPVERIEDWFNDKDIPSFYTLNLITIVFEHSSDMNVEALAQFKELFDMNPLDISPHGARMLPSLGEYIKRTIFSDESSILAKLNKDEQAEYLLNKYASQQTTN